MTHLSQVAAIHPAILIVDTTSMSNISPMRQQAPAASAAVPELLCSLPVVIRDTRVIRGFHPR
jgi:hypothetical protein